MRGVRRVGRYRILSPIASGGMGTVHLGRQIGDAGFTRVVAIKFLHPHLANIPEFVRRFLDEAHLAARVRHPNVVGTIDIVREGEELFLVMEFVRGESLAALARVSSERGERIPQRIALRILVDVLHGLHAAHTATAEDGAPLSIVHRDVSPQNVLVGVDGLSRLIDFGIAKAATSLHTTREGHLKGKLRYMAPEQITDEAVTPRTDVYAASVVLWETLTGRPLFTGGNDAVVLAKVLEGAVLPPSHFTEVAASLDAVVLRGLSRDPEARFATALDMAMALERAGEPLAEAREVAAWALGIAGERIHARDALVAGTTDVPALEADPSDGVETRTAPETDLTAETRAERPRGRWLLVGFIAAAATAFGLFAYQKSAASGVAPAPEIATPTTTTASASASPAPPASAVEAVVAPSASAAPSEIARSAPSGRAPSRAPGPGATPRPRSGPGKKPDCSTPYYEDSAGIRRVKRECL